MKYLHKFETQAQCKAYMNGSNYEEPFVGLVAETSKISYNKVIPPPLTFNITSPGTIRWTAYDTACTKTISYSTDNGATWTDVTSNTGSSAPTINVNAGDKVMFKGDNATYASGYTYNNSFNGSTAGFELEGNIMSLIDSTDTTLTSEYTFNGLFKGCMGLTSAENLVLPATTLTRGCYQGMFSGCTSLTIAPELPATTLSAGCYSSMFIGCTGLTTAPELPATTLMNACYNNMFYNCKSLTTAPELPATTLKSSCYSTMFAGCTSLNYIKCLATDISAYNCTFGWVNDVASTGTFVKNPNMSSWTTGVDGIPSGWTVQDAA